MIQSGNPVLNSNTFRDTWRTDSEVMTMGGTVYKTALLLLLATLTAAWTWRLFFKSGDPSVLAPWLIGGAIGGFVIAIITTFKKEWAAITAPLYAVCEGAFLGGISAVFEAGFPGIVIQAVLLTFGTLGAMLFAYQSGLIRATEKFKLGVFAATGAIALFYFISIILGFFGITVPFIYSNSLFGIGFSVFVVIIAALNLIIDFDFIEKGAQARAPHYMEWYSAFALMVTLVWLYLEILRLLSKVRNSR